MSQLRGRTWWLRRLVCLARTHDPENVIHDGQFWCRRRCGKSWRAG